eukprot:4423747-Prymnesium_polylepis.1
MVVAIAAAAAAARWQQWVGKGCVAHESGIVSSPSSASADLLVRPLSGTNGWVRTGASSPT